jgi:arginyl-tRNA synthetase
MSDVLKDVEDAILSAVRELFPLQFDSIASKLKVWMDHERGVVVSNIGFILGKETKSKPDVVTVMLASKLRDNPIYKDVYVTPSNFKRLPALIMQVDSAMIV